MPHSLTLLPTLLPCQLSLPLCVLPPVLTSTTTPPQPVFFILHTAFFGLHYLFASQTAHIGALYAAFLAMMLAAGGWWHVVWLSFCCSCNLLSLCACGVLSLS
jgi:di/tricarboxylate transporter